MKSHFDSGHNPAKESVKRQLRNLLHAYGPDFFVKLPLYKTAKLGDKYVGVEEIDLSNLEAKVKYHSQGESFYCDILDLTSFCL